MRKVKEWIIKHLGGFTLADIEQAFNNGRVADKNVVYFLNEDNFKINTQEKQDEER